jgi:hypothetical protein
MNENKISERTEQTRMKHMSKMGLKISLFCLGGLLLAAGCGEVDAGSKKAIKQFGTAMDARRASLKLLPVPKDARLKYLTNTSLIWIANDSQARHVSKTIVFNPEITALVSETDEVMCMGEIKTPPKEDLAPGNNDEDCGSSLTITTKYSADGQAIEQQTFTLLQGGKSTSPKAAEVEKLLTDWGLR